MVRTPLVVRDVLSDGMRVTYLGLLALLEIKITVNDYK